jgi:hypothetical protein
LEASLPAGAWEQPGFYERLYLYQSYNWYAFIRQDFLKYYRYSQKWVNLFHDQPLMIRVETSHYIKGLHNLLNAHFVTRNYGKFEEVLQQFERFAETERVRENDNFRIQAFIYITSSKINQHVMLGSFREGLIQVPEIEKKLREYELFIDQHRVLVLNYKIASLFFGAGDYGTCIDYLQRIINDPVDLRKDLQCYARLLRLLAHYELGNFELIEPLTKSVYRFMAKMDNLTVMEKEIFSFLRHSFKVSRTRLKLELNEFLQKIKLFEGNRFETRAFAYLDIISWLESKVYEKPMSRIIQEKYQASRKRSRVPREVS